MRLYYKGVLCNLATYRIMGEDKPALYYIASTDQETMLKAGFVDVQPCLWVKLLTDDEYNEIINQLDDTVNEHESMKLEGNMNKKILIVLTNTEKYEKNDIPTGLWLGELIHFYDEIKKNGFEADFVSPNGGYVPIDPYSMKYLNSIDYKWYRNKEFVNKALSNSLKPSEINSDDYFAIYYTGGHGVLWDFPNNQEIQKIAMSIYNSGGYITAVCHGVVGLLNLKNVDGDYLIKNKNITGFTNTEEFISQKSNKVPFSTEKELVKRGANYVKKRFFKSFAVIDERIITGQNPWSPKAVAELLVKEVKGKSV